MRLVLASLLVFVLAPARPLVAQPSSDSFELAPFWNTRQQNGTIELSSVVSHSGSESVKLTSTTAGQKNVWLTHTFPQTSKGTISVWFYDASPGVASLYAGLYASDSTQPANDFAVNVADWSGSNYVWHGPGVGEAPTQVTRTQGWHQFQLQVGAAGFDALIDQTVVGSVTGTFTFDTIYLLLSGPGGAPNVTFYFDDFSVSPIMAGPPTTPGSRPTHPRVGSFRQE